MNVLIVSYGPIVELRVFGCYSVWTAEFTNELSTVCMGLNYGVFVGVWRGINGALMGLIVSYGSIVELGCLGITA